MMVERTFPPGHVSPTPEAVGELVEYSCVVSNKLRLYKLSFQKMSETHFIFYFIYIIESYLE